MGTLSSGLCSGCFCMILELGEVAGIYKTVWTTGLSTVIKEMSADGNMERYAGISPSMGFSNHCIGEEMTAEKFQPI